MLREYALLADGQRGALIGPKGDLAWMCVPRWDSEAVFASLIGGGGVYAITPLERFVWGGYYEEGSLIWRSRWVTTTGIIECREALAFPGDPEEAVLLRRVEAKDGRARVRVVLEVGLDYGRRRLGLARTDHGDWQVSHGGVRARWWNAQEARPVDGHEGAPLVLDLDLDPGTHHDLVLQVGAGELGAPVDPGRAWSATEQAWRQEVPDLSDTLARRDTRHAYAVLRGLTARGGGMVAAATTSLPERAEQGRNYDYRYVWIRDQSYVAQAVAADGPHTLLDDAVSFVAARILTDGPELRPAYRIDGGSVPEETTLDLPGYPGGTDVIGNRVTRQFQLDAFGEGLLLLAAAARHDHLPRDGWRAAEMAVGAIESRLRDPDAGVWELDDQAWTHSRLTCVAGLRAMARAPIPARRAARWSALADEILADTTTWGLHPTGRWQRSASDPKVDGALLLPALRGGLAPEDPRTRATLDAVSADLARDGYVYRFRHGDAPLGQAEGAFLLCGFCMALARHQQGEEIEAARYLERNRAACGPPGLFAEEYDVGQRQLRGNVPQAFVHGLLLEAAVRLARPWHRATSGTRHS